MFVGMWAGVWRMRNSEKKNENSAWYSGKGDLRTIH